MLACLYGYNDASLMWFQLLSSVLQQFGYTQCEDEPCFFHKITDNVYSLVGVIVDDMLLASKPASANDALLAHLSKHFGIKDLREPRFLLGMHVTRPAAKKTIQNSTPETAVSYQVIGNARIILLLRAIYLVRTILYSVSSCEEI